MSLKRFSPSTPTRRKRPNATIAPPVASDEVNATLWQHLDELRRTLILALIALVVGIILCFSFYQNIFAWITQPLSHPGPLLHQEMRRERLFNPGPGETLYTVPPGATVHASDQARLVQGSTYAIPPGSFLEIDRLIAANELVLFGPTEGMLTALKVSFWLGLLLSSPVWATLLLRFALPALYPNERRLLWLFLGGTLTALLAGFSFAYLVTIPFANSYLETFNASIGRNLWSLSHYLDYTLMLMIANGMAFEFGLALFLLVHIGFLTAGWMASKRRHMIVLAFILGALLTPPDVPTQLMLALPLIGLYELAILYAKLRYGTRT